MSKAKPGAIVTFGELDFDLKKATGHLNREQKLELAEVYRHWAATLERWCQAEGASPWDCIVDPILLERLERMRPEKWVSFAAKLERWAAQIHGAIQSGIADVIFNPNASRETETELRLN